MSTWDKPLAAQGYISYRYPSTYGGYIMIGAVDDADAINEAQRSMCSEAASGDKLEVWDGSRYVKVTP